MSQMSHIAREVVRRRRIRRGSYVTLSLRSEHSRLTQFKTKQELKRALWDHLHVSLQAVRLPRQVSNSLVCGTEPSLYAYAEGR